MNDKWIKLGLFAAAFANISGVLLFSKGFTNHALNAADPVLMSNFGLVMIMVWGLAYLAVTFVSGTSKAIISVFVIEKLVYVIMWGKWLMTNSLIAVYAEDTFAGIFFTIYGLNDLFFMLLFAYMVYSQLGFVKQRMATSTDTNN